MVYINPLYQYQYQKWKREQHYRYHGHSKDNKEYYELIYAHKFDTLNEKDQSLKDTICQNSHKKEQSEKAYIY